MAYNFTIADFNRDAEMAQNLLKSAVATVEKDAKDGKPFNQQTMGIFVELHSLAEDMLMEYNIKLRMSKRGL